MPIFGKKKKGEDEDLPKDEVSEILEEAAAFTNNGGGSNEEEALLNQYLPGGSGDLSLSIDNDGDENGDGDDSSENSEDENKDSNEMDDDLLSIFTDEEVSDQDLTALTDGLEDVDVNSLLSESQT